MTECTVDNSCIVTHTRRAIRDSGMVPCGGEGALVHGLSASDFNIVGSMMEMDDGEAVHAVTLVLSVGGAFGATALFVDFVPSDVREVAAMLLMTADQLDGGKGTQ